MKRARVLKYGSVVLLAGVLVAAHVLFFYRIPHMARAVGLGLILLVLAIHVGLLGPICALFKRRSQNQ